MQHYSSVPTRTLQDAERAHITKTLHETNWVVGGRDGAAAKLGLARTTLIAMMQRLGIRREKFGHGAEQPNQLFVTTPRGYLHASHDTPRETAFKINSRLNNDTAA